MKKISSCFLIISIIIMMVSCTDYNENSHVSTTIMVSENSYDSESSTKNRYYDITNISTYVKDQFNAGSLQLETMVTKYNINDFEKNEIISEIFSNDNFFYKALMIDENTVIVQKNVIFQSVTGYVATKNETLDTIEDERYKNPILNIPSSLGYDGNNLSVDKYLGEFDEWHLYKYTAGL